MAQKRKSKRKGKQKPGKVVDLAKKRAEKLVGEVQSLTVQWAAGRDEQVALLLDHYRQWEDEHPERALRASQKLEMVRLGFIGPAGLDRCLEPDRLPEDAFLGDEHDLYVGEELLDDCLGAEVLMCPAKAARACQGIWREHRIPPCYLLLLEVYAGLGGGFIDDRVGEVLEDYPRFDGPDEYEKSFAEAERVLRRYRRKP